MFRPSTSHSPRATIWVGSASNDDLAPPAFLPTTQIKASPLPPLASPGPDFWPNSFGAKCKCMMACANHRNGFHSVKCALQQVKQHRLFHQGRGATGDPGYLGNNGNNINITDGMNPLRGRYRRPADVMGISTSFAASKPESFHPSWQAYLFAVVLRCCRAPFLYRGTQFALHRFRQCRTPPRYGN